MNLLEALVNAIRLPELRNKILFTGGILVIFRLFANVAVPGASQAALAQLFNSQALLGLLDLFSGGGLSRFSVVAMGMNPYINATIIMQLMTVISERIKEIQKEGEQGRRRIQRWSRWLTVFLGAGQAYGFTVLFQNTNPAILPGLDWFQRLSIVLVLTAGTVMLMWFGELITEYGIGNGVSLIIFAGIIGRGPPGELPAPPREPRRRHPDHLRDLGDVPAHDHLQLLSGRAARHVVLQGRRLDPRQLHAGHRQPPDGDHVQRALLRVHVRLYVLLYSDHIRGHGGGRQSQAILELHSRHPSGPSDRGLPGVRDEPGHVRRRVLPGLHHRDPAHRHRQDLGHSSPADVPRRHRDPDRRGCGPGHHEAAAGAAGHAPVPRLHTMSKFTSPRSGEVGTRLRVPGGDAR